jgi:hypothetical protein
LGWEITVEIDIAFLHLFAITITRIYFEAEFLIHKLYKHFALREEKEGDRNT